MLMEILKVKLLKQDSLRKPDTEVRPILIPDTVPKAVGFMGALKIPVSTNNSRLT